MFYDPPENFNNVIGTVDSFTYSVTDDGTTYVGGQLISDPQSSTNTVQFNLNPVNDRPQFNVSLQPADPNDPTGPLEPIEAVEDDGRTVIGSFAFGIEPAPPTTAFDEVNVISGQQVRFSVTSLGFPQSQSTDFFTEFPTITPDGTLSFLPAPDVFGSFPFEVILTDDGPGNETRGDLISSHPVTITIDVLPVNDPPVVRTDVDPLNFTIDEDTSVDIFNRGTVSNPGLLDVFDVGPANEGQDLTPGGNQTLALKEPTPVQTNFGTITQLRNNGELIGLRYTPGPNFVGTDSFIYTVTDDGITVDLGQNGVGRFDPRIASNTVSINVNPINNAPQFSGPANVTVNEDSGPVAIAGWATNVLPGPPTAIDELESQDVYFEITQTSGSSSLFAVAPVAVVDNDTRTATLQFEPAGDANGVATFAVQLFDEPTDGTQQESSAIRTFTLRINPVNDPPTFSTPLDPVTVNEDSGPYAKPWATNISPGPSDEQDQSVRFEVVIPTDSESLFLQLPEISDDGILRFIPAANANGIVDMTVTAIDSGGAVSDQVLLRIDIQAVNDQPTAVSDNVATDEDTVLVIPTSQLLLNDIDPDIGNPDDFLTFMLPNMVTETTSLSGATVTFDSVTGQVTYDPTTSLALQSLPPYEPAVLDNQGNVIVEEKGRLLDSFTYQVEDSAGVDSNVVSVTVTVDGVNDAPVALADNPTLNPDGPTVIEILANDSDVDGTIVPTSIEVTLQPAFGSIDIDDDGVVTYTAFQSFSLEDVFRYRVADNLGQFSADAQVSIQANAAPIARNDQALTFVDEAIEINVVANDEDPNAAQGAPNGGLDLTSIQIVNGPLSGDAVPLGNGTIRYIPAAGFLGIESFQYTIADSEGRDSSPATVRVQVVGSRLQNPDINADVNNDGNVTPIDALLVINRLARANEGSIPVTEDSSPIVIDDDGNTVFRYYDVNGDKEITPRDALQVINELQRRAANGLGEQVEGEQVATDQLEAPLALDFLDSLADDRDEDERLDAVDAAFGDLI